MLSRSGTWLLSAPSSEERLPWRFSEFHRAVWSSRLGRWTCGGWPTAGSLRVGTWKTLRACEAPLVANGVGRSNHVRHVRPAGWVRVQEVLQIRRRYAGPDRQNKEVDH